MFAQILRVVLIATCIPAFDAFLTAQEPTAQSSCVVSAGELQTQASAFLVLDVRTQDQYAAGHIPHSIWVDFGAWTAKAAEPTGLNDRPYWSQQLGLLGVSPSQPIALVGDSLPNTARAWWLLKYCGLADVRLLDGGYAAWLEQKLPASTERPVVEKTTPNIEFQPQRLALLADMDLSTKGAINILDARSDAEFTGARGVGVRTGHVPQAKNLEWSSFVGKDGKLLTATEIKALLQKSGFDLEAPTITYCQTGGRSSVVALALEIAGAEKVKNYYRGWSEYNSAIALPVEK